MLFDSSEYRQPVKLITIHTTVLTFHLAFISSAKLNPSQGARGYTALLPDRPWFV